MVLNQYGHVAQHCWVDIPRHFPNVVLDEFVIMPNHMHGIIVLLDANHIAVGATHASPLQNNDSISTRPQGPKKQSISSIVGSFKSAVTKRVNQMRDTPGAKLWQRNYWEHIIRDENELKRIREYIANNPLQWEWDRENPNADNSLAEAGI